MAAAQPNILLITCHDLGRTLNCYGAATVRSPRLDALAAEGVRFSNAFCVAPQCSPSRAALYTGRYPHANGVLGLTHGAFGWDLHPEERHIGQALRDAGFATVVLGVMHEARDAARCGLTQVLPEAGGAATTRAALEQLAQLRDAGRPFYIQVGYHEPHRVEAPGQADYSGFLSAEFAPDDELGVTIPPYLVDEPSAHEELAELQGAVRHMDASVGALLAGLRELGLEQDTLLLFTTDHGPALPRAKCTLYDPGLGIALIARYPAGGWVGGRVVDALVSNVDLFPTLLRAAGLPLPGPLHGHDLGQLLAGGSTPVRDAAYAEMTYHDYYDPRRAIRAAGYNLVLNFTMAPAFMDPTQSWRPRTRPVVPANPATAFHPLLELYDLAADPLEWHNVANDPAHATTQRDLLARLHAWMRATDDPLLAGAVTSPTHARAVEALEGSRV